MTGRAGVIDQLKEVGILATAVPSEFVYPPLEEAPTYGIKSVEEAIAYVYRVAEGFVIKQKAQGLPYSFAGEAAIIETVRPAMVAAQLNVRVHEILDVRREQVTSSKGAVQMYTTLRAVVRFSHAPSGTFVDCQALGEGADSGDKSVPKAMTGAYKYALRQTFCLETGNDPDAQTGYDRGDSAPSRPNPLRAAAQAQQRAPAAVEVPPDPEREQWHEALVEARANGVKFGPIIELLGGPFQMEGDGAKAWAKSAGPQALSRWLGANPDATVATFISRAADLQAAQ